MTPNHKFVAIIPARKGSQRLPGKNTKPLAGKPLISWSIDAAKESQYLDQIIVTSDCPTALDIARQSGVVALQRPEALSCSHTKASDVIVHALKTLDPSYDFFVYLQPTSPLRTVDDIDDSIAQLISTSANSIVSVSKSEHSPLWCNTLPEDNSMSKFISEAAENARSQDLPDYFRINGAIYICQIARYLREKSFFSESTYAYRMPVERSIDIDESYDFICAQALLEFNTDSPR